MQRLQHVQKNMPQQKAMASCWQWGTLYFVGKKDIYMHSGCDTKRVQLWPRSNTVQKSISGLHFGETFINFDQLPWPNSELQKNPEISFYHQCVCYAHTQLEYDEEKDCGTSLIKYI